MSFMPGYEFIIKNKLGTVFNFYLNEKQHIECIISDTNGKWKNKHMVLSEPTENFHIEIDNKDNIHIISFHSSGNLYYSKYNNKEWINHLIMEYPTEEQKVLYPTIKYINNQVHIFYYLINTKERNKAHLLHLNFYNKDYNSNHITTVYSHSYVNPFKIFIDGDKIILLYGSVINKFDQIFITKFNMINNEWTESIPITSSKDKKVYINGLLDNNKTLHIIWSKFNEEHLSVQYLNLNIDKLDHSLNNLNPVPLSSESSCSFPTLCYFKNTLWAIWTEVNKVVSCYSIDIGKNWSAPVIDEETRKLDFKRYRYISNCPNEQNNILCDFIFGSLYPNIKFLGFGGEANDEISTS